MTGDGPVLDARGVGGLTASGAAAVGRRRYAMGCGQGARGRLASTADTDAGSGEVAGPHLCPQRRAGREPTARRAGNEEDEGAEVGHKG